MADMMPSQPETAVEAVTSSLALTQISGCKHNDRFQLERLQALCCIGCGLVMKPTALARNPYSDVQSQKQSAIQSGSDKRDPESKPITYVHPPLPIDRGYFVRLLNLYPGSSGDPLFGDFEIVNLTTRPAYEAVSYTWADKDGKDELSGAICFGSDQRSLNITKNCEAALRCLRRTDDKRRIWIDAVCIDQNNIYERNHQVQQMLFIFRSSKHVRIYLGEEYAQAEGVIRYLSSFGQDRYPTSEDVAALFRCRWFHRLWVLQEIDVPVDKTILCGAESCSWDSLVSFCKFLERCTRMGHPIELPSVMSFGLLSDRNMRNRIKTELDPLRMLQIARNSACKDPRDKFYAIRGLVSANFSRAVPTDYSQDVTAAWIYVQLAALHLLETKDLQIFAYIQPPRENPQSTGVELIAIPSWVPDWNTPTLEPLSSPCFTPQVTTPRIPPRIVARADGNEITLTGRFNTNIPVDSYLRIRGRRIGTVWPDSFIFRPQNFNRPSNSSMNGVTSWEMNWIMNPSANEGSRTCSRRRAFWYRFSEYIYNNDNGLYDSGYLADVPPAFGGFCAGCLRVDLINWCSFTRLNQVHVQRCLCYSKIISQMDNQAESHNPNHYFEDRLDEFYRIFEQHGSGRRLFGTEHSLGFGPNNLEFGDTVWVLEGARAPTIIRPSDPSTRRRRHYTVVGECYLYDATSGHDTCAVCNSRVPRRTIERDIKFEEGAEYCEIRQLFEKVEKNNETNASSACSEVEEIEIW